MNCSEALPKIEASSHLKRSSSIENNRGARFKPIGIVPDSVYKTKPASKPPKPKAKESIDIPMSSIPLELALPEVSAQSWCVLDGKRNTLLYGKDEHARREMASLTKIMTCYAVLLLSEELSMGLHTTKI